uniref:Uncharacterized protein n=1 Tax=Oryza barthii TaxID=65489 RepID=A0A0D3EYS2_9ORYZ
MESARFVYELDHGGEGEEEEEEEACFLDIYVHGARGIHNICIYAAQDVYAKLALTSSPDDAPALAKRLLDDQLLGFALVPLTDVAAADGARLAQDFSLSSTDLFHSPAGTIRLSLALHSGPPGDACPPPERATAEPSITSEVVILEPAPPVDYARIEFPDLNAVKENDDMAEKGAAEDVFDSPPALRDIDMEAEQSAMQRQIMEMYMKSMQQFTESLSKMKLPMELDGDNGVVVQKEEKPQAEVKLQPKKDGARVFYGSRAFF